MKTNRRRLLLVDDDANLLHLLKIRLTAAGIEVKTAESGERALACLPLFRPDVVVTDLCMNGMDGLALFDLLNEKYPTLPVIIVTAHGTIQDAVEATKRGVFGFLTKPLDSKELIQYVDKAMHLCGEGALNGTPRDWRWSNIVTQSPLMEDLLKQAQRLAQSDVSVFVHGESGTGKELLARGIHEASRRKHQPFIALNCSAFPESLLESELFGHRKGAFTGASRNHDGVFRAAEGGTLFLDEVGDMPGSFQVKLLRALQDRRVRAVGSTRDVPVDVRIISATHIDLEKSMADGRFRKDLYYRLNVAALYLPPLSKRREDIPLLASHFLKDLGDRYGGRVKGFSPEAVECLMRYDWPGNIRQLHNVVEQAVALSATPLITVTLIQKALSSAPQSLPSLREAREEFERNYLIGLMQMTRGNVTHAARLAKRNRTEFYRLLSRYQLDPGLFKAV